MCNCSSRQRVVWLKGVTPIAAWWRITGDITVFTPTWTAATTELTVSVHTQYCFFPSPSSPSSLSCSAEKNWNKYWAPSIYHYSGWGISADCLWQVSTWHRCDLWPLTPQSPPDCGWEVAFQYDALALPCDSGKQITPWNGLLLAPGHLLWGWRTLKILGIVGGEGCKLILRNELRFLSKPKYKALLGSTSPQWGWRVAWINMSTEAASLQVNVSPLWHTYTCGKPFQGKTDITFVILTHFLEYNLSSSTNVRKKTCLVGEQIGEWEV